MTQLDYYAFKAKEVAYSHLSDFERMSAGGHIKQWGGLPDTSEPRHY